MKHIPYLIAALEGGNTKRCHTLRVLEEENVAAHSFGVAWMCVYLCGDEKPDVSLILAALAHDLPEQKYGDIPADAKKRDPALAVILHELDNEWLYGHNLNYEDGLSGNEKAILKLADSFHLMWKCVRERQMGNTTMGVVWNNLDGWIDEQLARVSQPDTHQLATNLLSTLHKLWYLSNERK